MTVFPVTKIIKTILDKQWDHMGPVYHFVRLVYLRHELAHASNRLITRDEKNRPIKFQKLKASERAHTIFNV